MKTKSIISFFLILTISLGVQTSAQAWHSKLYSENWKPGFKDAEGHFLHDFSYAGYHSGLKEIPTVTMNILNVTLPPYNVDNTGKEDVTETLQKAINELTRKGGGVLYLPAGEYLTSVEDDDEMGLRIFSSNIVIRGDGPDKTFIKNTSYMMRGKTLIRFFSRNGKWDKATDKEVKLSADVLLPTQIIPLEDVSSFKVGDYIILKHDVTDDFRKEHKVGDNWDKVTKGTHFYRQITAVNANNKTIEIDVPTRYYLKKRDNARVYIARPQISECGVENLSIGNVQHPNPDGWTEPDWNIQGKGHYDVHRSHLLEFINATDCWVRNVHTYKPQENKDNIHVLSNCLVLTQCRFITVQDCDFRNTQGKGGGGNGYLYTLGSNECLIRDCYAENGRHHFSFKGMSANGNVIYNCYSKDSYLPSDFHMYLSMANLFDGFKADGDYISAKFRPWGFAKGIHMYSTTETVMWNTQGLKLHPRVDHLIYSQQYGNGYVIGTSGVLSKVLTQPVVGEDRGIQFDTTPEDWVEGEGKGETLVPQSLYISQLEKRKIREQITKK
ncbi:hypothetical protein MASR2M117_00030 [Paludibacter sp.]